MNGRPIKFRLWDKLTNRMIYPGNVSYWLNINGRPYCTQNGSGGDEYEVMQSSALLDYKELEIYEGDIVACKFFNVTEFRKVIWEKAWAGFRVTESTNIDYQGRFNYLTTINIKHWEVRVVGNIFENPNLCES